MEERGTLLARPPSAAGEEGPPPQPIAGILLQKLLARGGFAEVWEADQVSLGRKVAVKILRPELLGQSQMVRLFEQEARVLARLNHPNVVQVIDRGVSERGPYFVMEYVIGQTLQELLTQGKLSRDRAMTILLQATRGLAYAHRNKVVHRDVKPANILVSRSGHVKIGDFGIAAVRAAASGKIEEDTGPAGKQVALGTRAFMAPEQRSSFDGVGPAADIYSLGVILHRILTGKLPKGPGRIADGVTIPDHLLPIVERSLSPDPAGRYADAGSFREALVNALGGRHIEDPVRAGADSTIGPQGQFEMLDVIRQDAWRSVYLVRKGGPNGARFVVKRYLKKADALRRVRELLRVHHPNIVRIHAVGEREDAFMMLMEHLPGGDLRERLVRPHAWPEVVRVGRDVAAALAYAHARGIVHGNLRPSNVLFDGVGGIRVTDFGLPEHYVGESKRNWYAPPEGGTSTAADLYALGAILFEMLCAASVSDAGSARSIIGQRHEDVPDALVGIIERLLAPAGTRYTSADAVGADLALCDEQQRSDAGPRRYQVAPAFVQAAMVRDRSRSYAPALLGLGGLVLVWLLETWVVQDWIVNRFAR
jgi:eukaryotic-like serine/threonine-protein kinase